MIIVFCGHSTYVSKPEDEKKILDILEKRVGDEPCEIFLGEYGFFDSFAYDCSKKFKENHPNSKLIFVTPYSSLEHRKKYGEYSKNRFDMIIYPELDNVPLRFAISKRNKWMVEQADIVIAYITHTYGGAYATYRNAKKKNKEIYNISSCSIE